MAQPYTIKSGDPRNDSTPAAPKGYSQFDLSHLFLQTQRFGELTPTESFEVVKGDKISLRLQQDTSSYSLKAPLKSDMFKKSSNFFVPLQAIIRNNWELLVTQPVNGDDVPQDVDGVVSAARINSFFSDLVNMLTTYSYEGDANDSVFLTGFVRNLLIAEMFFSQGSLLKQLYYDFSHCVEAQMIVGEDVKYVSFDRFLEYVLARINPVQPDGTGLGPYRAFRIRWFDEDGQVTDTFRVVSEALLTDNPSRIVPNPAYVQDISFRHCLDLCRQNLNFLIDEIITVDDVQQSIIIQDFLDMSQDVPALALYFNAPLTDDINFDKVSAYQIIAAHFYSLDFVDYIYSAELYRQLMQYYFDNASVEDGFSEDRYFTWNGMHLNYDALSGKFIHTMAFSGSLVSPLSGAQVNFDYYRCYLTALFSFRHSLRYLDYFTGGRTRPLSVGSSTDPNANISVPVVNNSVDAVDVFVSQNAARFLNFAQRTGRKISKWLSDLLPGGELKPDFHDPQWLSTVGDPLNPEQTQNTGALQASEAQSITARFKNDSNRYMYKYEPDRPGYMISICYYDIPRSYAFATAKENLHRDRYDRFNPFFQYNGSQEVKRQELGIAGSDPFSYQGRYEEYKQNYAIAAGGFVENLPGFAFIADVQSGIPMQTHLNPTYVRSWNVELDPFYLALTGFGLAAYFHFIVKNVNIITAIRPMEYQPQLM